MMNDDSGKSKKLSLSGSRLTLGGLEAGQPRANTGGAARRTVQVEVRRKRAPAAPHRATTPKADPVEATPKAAPVAAPVPAPESDADDRLTAQERAARVRALQEGMKKPETETPPGAAKTPRQRTRPKRRVAKRLPLRKPRRNRLWKHRQSRLTRQMPAAQLNLPS